jgi:hypothetical protein
MRITIKSLQLELKNAREDSNSYKVQLEQIKSVLFPHTSLHIHTSKDILLEIVQLVGYKNYNQGAINPDRETISILKEIIRWKINPETAMESKVQERLNDFRQ